MKPMMNETVTVCKESIARAHAGLLPRGFFTVPKSSYSMKEEDAIDVVFTTSVPTSILTESDILP